MNGVFFLVGPTAVGKSEIAAAVAQQAGAEIVSADAFQIYRGLDLLSAKPDAATLARAPHHLIGATSLGEEMSAQRFRALALTSIGEIRQREKPAIVVGGSGLYVKALTHGFEIHPPPNPKLREELAGLTPLELVRRLEELNPQLATKTDLKNPRRVSRAIEISVIPSTVEESRGESLKETPCRFSTANGIFLFRDRDDLYARINRRVEEMFTDGVIDEVRAIQNVGATAAQMLGLREIRQLMAGEGSEAECIAAIQQATRRYAKRQLTWFRGQTNFPSLNLSLQNTAASVEQILREMRLSFSQPG